MIYPAKRYHFFQCAIAAILLFSGLFFCRQLFAEPTISPKPQVAVIVPTRPSDTSILLRSQPSFLAKSPGSVATGSTVTVLATEKQKEKLPWYQIKLPDQSTAWIYGQYIQLKADQTTPAETGAPSPKPQTESTLVQPAVQPAQTATISQPQKVSAEQQQTVNTLESTTTGTARRPLPEIKPSHIKNAVIFLDLSETPRKAVVESQPALVVDAPGSTDQPKHTLKLNQQIIVTGAARVAKQPHPWFRIVLENQETGWVYGGQIKIILNQPSAQPGSEKIKTVSEGYPRNLVITVNNLAVRQTPSRAARKIAQKNQRDAVVAIAEARIRNERWLQIQLEGNQTGWILASYTKPATTANTSPSQTNPPSAVKDPPQENNRKPVESAQRQTETPPALVLAREGYPVTLTITSNKLAVRQTPARSSQQIAQKDRLDTVEAIAETLIQNERWVQIKLPNNQTGWIFGSYTKPASQTDLPQLLANQKPAASTLAESLQKPPDKRLSDAHLASPMAAEKKDQQASLADKSLQQTATVTRAFINLRDSPSTTAPVVSRLTKNQPVTIVSVKQTGEAYPWYQIKSPAGWVYGQFLDVSNPADTPASQLPQTESFTITKTARITGGAPILRQSYTGKSAKIAQLTALDAREIEVLAQHRGKEPYFWYQIKHPAYGIAWIYGQFLRFDDETTRFSPIYLAMLDIDEQYGSTVQEVIQKLGPPVSQDVETGQLKSLSTDYQGITLTYDGLTLHFLRYFEQDHLLEIEIKKAPYPLAKFALGMYKSDIMAALGENRVSQGYYGGTLTYIDPVSGQSKLVFILNPQYQVIGMRKIAWIE